MKRSLACAVSALPLLVALLSVVTTPVAAQSVNRALIDNLNRKLLYVALPLLMAVEFVLVYTLYRYRNNDDPTPTEENRRLEITWTVVTAIILTFVGVASMVVFVNPYISPVVAADATVDGEPNPQLQGAVQPDDESAVEVEVLAYQWGWEFHYAESNVTTHGTLVLPADREVYLHVTSADVIHSFYAPSLGLKQDVMPGAYNTVRTRLTEPGNYSLYCAEFCGSGHSRMRGEIVVLSDEEYREWLSEGNESTATARVATASGEPAGTGRE